MSEFQKRILRPLSLPIIAVVFVGALVISLSRVLLAVPEASSTVIALLVAAEVLGIASLLAATTRTKPAQRALMLVLALGLLGAGAASAKVGVRHEELAVGVPVPIAAKGTQFSTKELDFPADTKVSLDFANNDVGIGHNVAIFKDDTLSTVLFRGTVITGTASIPYAIPPLKPGNYYFHCDVHPQQMNGKVVVGNAPPGGVAAPPSSPSPTPSASAPAGVPANTTTVIAKDLKFNVTTFTLKANANDSITLDNQDNGIPHNLAILTKEGGDVIVRGVTPFNGIAKQTWNFQAPQPGTYFFHCEVHPDMKGQVIFR
jgi:plastocyanin